jgi:multidrug resistance efflux pump
VHVQEGQFVKVGTVLVELEPFDLREREQELQLSLAALEAEYRRVSSGFRQEEQAQAKAKLDQLQARLDLLRAGPRPQEIEAARARLALAQADHTRAEQDFQRVSRLAMANATSQQVLDTTTAQMLVRQEELALLELGTREEELREATARVEEARQAWQLMKHGFRQEEIDQAKAARDAAQAKLDALRKQMEELSIKSPIDGTIEALSLQPGDMVAAGAPVLSMLDQNDLWVRAYVPPNLPGIQVGAHVRVTIDSVPNREFSGLIVFISRQAEFTPSNIQTPEERSKQVFRIKIIIEDTDVELRPGMLADVWLDEIGESQ